MKKFERCIRKDEFAAAWSEQETETERAFVIILRTSGCAWAARGGCLMCGYSSESLQGVCQEDIEAQVAKALAKYSGEAVVKLYTSGSFLDEKEIPDPARIWQTLLDAGARRLLVESRPEFVEPSLSDIEPFKGKLEVAMGLETANDSVRERCVRKGFTFADFSAASESLRGAGSTVRTYLLLKPLFLGEADAMADALSSVGTASAHSDVISLNPVNVQRRTLVERMWRRAEYRPPWLWSIAEVLSKAEKGKARLVSSPSGGGTQRGAHNCGKCDAVFLDAVSKYSLTQDADVFRGLGCECSELWRDILELESRAMTTTDLERTSWRG
ncbi:MAG: archaeosine biosynthesis radical SAM protein RaSEA [Methanobacteriota archaeon]